jgi:hypothetical protein
MGWKRGMLRARAWERVTGAMAAERFEGKAGEKEKRKRKRKWREKRKRKIIRQYYQC